MGEDFEVIILATKDNFLLVKLGFDKFYSNFGTANIRIITRERDFKLYHMAFSKKCTVQNEKDVLGNMWEKILTSFGSLKGINKFWYLQQFIKLYAARTSNFANVVIWDGDTIPLGSIKFFSSENKLLINLSKEFHPPYYNTNRTLIGVEHLVPDSFISQFIPIQRRHVESLFHMTENRFAMPFWNCVFVALDRSHPQAFSEYEILGDYINVYFSEDIEFTTRKWLRNGASNINKNLLEIDSAADKFAADYLYVSFENYDFKRSLFTRVKESLLRQFYSFKS